MNRRWQTFAFLQCEAFYLYKIYALLTKREVKMAGYWPSSFFAFLWTETKSKKSTLEGIRYP